MNIELAEPLTQDFCNRHCKVGWDCVVELCPFFTAAKHAQEKVLRQVVEGLRAKRVLLLDGTVKPALDIFKEFGKRDLLDELIKEIEELLK